MQNTTTSNNIYQQVDPNGLLLHNLSVLLNSIDGLTYLKLYSTATHNRKNPHETWRSSKSFIKEGGADPLDHIDIYKVEEDNEHDIPEHWHYIGYGLSDIYNYRKIYESNPHAYYEFYPPPVDQFKSGFGIELTIRVKSYNEDKAPEWPRIILQSLAKYIFQSRITCDAGDHVAFNQPLDNDESNIRHVLMVEDPRMKSVDTQTGKVKFIQLVGVCDEELETARKWNVEGLLEIMKERIETGGSYLVTDMRRGETVFQLDPATESRVLDGIERMGSDLSSISTRHLYNYYKPTWFKKVEQANENPKTNQTEEQIEEIDESIYHQDRDEDESNHYYGPSLRVERGNIQDLNRDCFHSNDCPDQTRTPSRMSYESESNLLIENIQIENARYLKSVYLLIDTQTARIFPIFLKGRLPHKRRFTLQNYKGDLATTFVPEGSSADLLVSNEKPIAKCGPLLHIYVPDDLSKIMSDTIGKDFESGRVQLPKNYSWPEHNLFITVANQIEDVET